MFGTRIHGRGGQGVVTAAELLSVAAFDSGHHAQAFPSFGSERTGAPVVAYCRIDDTPIRTREPIMIPDGLIIQDATLLSQIDVLAGRPEHAYVLINAAADLTELGLAEFLADHRAERVMTLPATEMALRALGRPVPNVVLLGGFAALTSLITVEALEVALAERFSGVVLDGNRAAAREAFADVSARISAQRGVVDAATD
ncbi:MAG: 2-oxoacid:acceptor oxidoreductase family protein [Candidatus Nanopelagicales bacterium]